MGLELVGKLKQAQGLKTDELAQLSGVPVGTLNKILNGQTKNPSLETVFALAHALGCSVDDFDDEDTIKKDNPIEGLPEEIQDLISRWDKLSNENKLKITGMIDLKLSEQED
ncbi:helix-turn-helix domain-containing protein [Desulfosporosinus fructosivorans]|uniref:helix-turn-helix domain-containing protein n=1 Tax=Desulfosporosinus fructosivorans TaxID=2018669 RepID=UPI00130E7B6D|nr:helix-turn-helix transcriptional regulator [Desulfosporosinus fructosivorans]